MRKKILSFCLIGTLCISLNAGMMTAMATDSQKQNNVNTVQNSEEKEASDANGSQENVTDHENDTSNKDDVNNENGTDNKDDVNNENDNKNNDETVDNENQGNDSSEQKNNQMDELTDGRVYEIHSDETPDDLMNRPSLFTIPGQWKQDANGWWYLHNDGGFPANMWEEINGKYYYFDERGYMFVGWLNYQGHWYYTEPSGAMVDGFQYIGEQWYYFYPYAGGPHGAMATGFILDPASNRWFYLAGNGIMQTGWHQINNKWYYFNNVADGSHGAMMIGWICLEEKWYFLEDQANGHQGEMITGWSERIFARPVDNLNKSLFHFFTKSGVWSTASDVLGCDKGWNTNQDRQFTAGKVNMAYRTSSKWSSAVKGAMNLWRDASLGISFKAAPSGTFASLDFRDDSSLSRSEDALTYFSVSSGSSSIAGFPLNSNWVRAEIHINPNASITPIKIAHELGHAFGLSHRFYYYSGSVSIMYWIDKYMKNSKKVEVIDKSTYLHIY